MQGDEYPRSGEAAQDRDLDNEALRTLLKVIRKRRGQSLLSKKKPQAEEKDKQAEFAALVAAQAKGEE